LGIVESVETNKDLVREDTPLNEDTLLNILAHSKKEIEEDKSFTMEEVKKQIESWKKERK